MQLVINNRGQPFERSLVPVTPGAEQLAYVANGRITRFLWLLDCHGLNYIASPWSPPGITTLA